MNPATDTKLSYRPEIDGLRAIAVISIILYHAQPVLFGRNVFEGGFIGVDMFFVISGYLIARIILFEHIGTGSFSFKTFYERRARRLLPMLFLVIFVSVPFAWQLLLPSDFVEYADSVIASLLFVSNFFFYFSTTEYGADSALLKPFLHTWSLGVEEQFYLVFPLLVATSLRVSNAIFLFSILLLSLLSLLWSEFLGVRNGPLNFFLPISRFWEFGVGALLAYRELFSAPTVKHVGIRLLPLIGLSLVLYAIWSFDADTPHPGVHTTIPVLGVAMIIAFSSKDEWAGAMLRSRLFVWVGLISYSAYLWHFPIFAFSRMVKQPSHLDKMTWVLLTLFLSVLSYFFIERPFRDRSKVPVPAFYATLGSAFLLAIPFAGYVKYESGVLNRYSKPEQEIITLLEQREHRALESPSGHVGVDGRDAHKMTIKCNSRTVATACRYGSEKLVFLGDSYVGAIQRAFIDIYRGWDHGFISLSFEQCPFIMDPAWYKNVTKCAVQNGDRIKLIQSFERPKVVFLSANDRQFTVPNELRRQLLPSGSKSDWKRYKESQFNLAWASYSEGVEWLLDLGHKVVVVHTPPRPTLNSLTWLPKNLNKLTSSGFPAIYNDTSPGDRRTTNASRFSSMDGLVVVDPVDALCEPTLSELKKNSCLDVHPDLGPLYNGGGHLSYNGAMLVAKEAEPLLIRSGVFRFLERTP